MFKFKNIRIGKTIIRRFIMTYTSNTTVPGAITSSFSITVLYPTLGHRRTNWVYNTVVREVRQCSMNKIKILKAGVDKIVHYCLQMSNAWF